MQRWIYAYRYVRGMPAELERALLDDPPALLRAASGSTDGEPAIDGSFAMDVELPVGGVELAKRVRVRPGVAYRREPRVVLPLAWEAEPGRAVFPTFTGTLELAPLDERTAQLSLAGSYRPPLGPVGALVDVTVLHGAAQRTAERLVRGLSAALEQRRGVAPADHEPRRRPRRGAPLRVGDVMTDEPLVLDERLPLRTAALLLFHAEVSGAPVVAASGALVGVLSERDLLAKEATVRFGWGRRAADEQRRRAARTVGEACTRPARVTVAAARLADVAREMLDADVNRLVVIDHSRIAGVVSRHDVLVALLCDDTDIAEAVRRVLDAEGAEDVEVTVSWGEARLAGRTALRSTAERLPGLVAAAEGVMTVDATGLSWETDDVTSLMPFV